MEKEIYNPGCLTVRKNHAFFWNTQLPFERMEQISNWIGSLSPEERKMLDDLLDDYRDDCEWTENRE